MLSTRRSHGHGHVHGYTNEDIFAPYIFYFEQLKKSAWSVRKNFGIKYKKATFLSMPEELSAEDLNEMRTSLPKWR